ncbi:metalloendopeptidase OMA1, mitochondrial [Silurus meridionalis]|nr:metalloendopeptidase OMA1, mitochondrial [Silurus meridionalis]
MALFCIRFGQKSPLTLSRLLYQRSIPHSCRSTNPGFLSSDLRSDARFSTKSLIDHKRLSVHVRQVPVFCPAFSDHVKKFHTSEKLQAPPAVVLWLLVKPLQKITAIILGRSIRKWWKALPPKKKQLFREWAWQRRWHLTGVSTVVLLFMALFCFTHVEESPLTGRSRFLVFSRDNFIKLSEHASEMYLEEFEDSLIPENDPRHQVVMRVVQHLADRNQDIEEFKSVPWTVHVIEKPIANAYVMPNGRIFVFTGMLELVGDIHQLSIILGHEMAHALLGHAFSLNRPYSRKLEAEADQVGLQLAAKACVDVRAGPVVWQKMELFEQIAGEPTLPEWCSTHPSHRTRISNLDHLVPEACVDVRAGPVVWQKMELFEQIAGEPTLPEWCSTHPSHRTRISNLDHLVPEAIELRARCGCPAFTEPDPRVVFAKVAQLLLEDNENQKNKAKESKERERAEGTQHTLLSKKDMEPAA